MKRNRLPSEANSGRVTDPGEERPGGGGNRDTGDRLVNQASYCSLPIRIGERGSPFLGWTSWSPVSRMGPIEIQIGVGIEIDGGGCPARVGCSWAIAFSCAASLRRKATSDRLHGAALTRGLVAVASWSADVLNRFLGGCPNLFGGPLLFGIGALTRKAPEDWAHSKTLPRACKFFLWAGDENEM